MKLTAMMITRNEAGRYLEQTLPALREFCDEIRVVDDDSTDGTHSILERNGAVVLRNDRPEFYLHEGRARNKLLDWTLQGQPTHIIAIDADELVEDGSEIRRQIEQRTSPQGIWRLTMEEVWKADEQWLYERVDGKWGSRKVPIVFEVPTVRRGAWRIADRALASGREPMQVAKFGARSNVPTICSVFHLGWACQADRRARYERYAVHDGGRFHAGDHLSSIMWPDEQVGLRPRLWPASWETMKPTLLERINRG